MVEVTVLKAGDPSPKADGAYVQVITRKEQEGNPGKIVSDIEHFALEGDGSKTSLSRETRDIGFKDAIDAARFYAEDQGVAVVYARDRTAADIA